MAQSLRVTVFFKESYQLFLGALLLLVNALFLTSCKSGEKNDHLLMEEKKRWEEIIYEQGLSTDSLESLLIKGIASDNHIAITFLSKELGNRARSVSNFSSAIEYHRKGLEAAYVNNDTVEITRALNNIATDFRRIGAFPDASEYHYQALYLAESYSGKHEFIGRKNRVIAINGLGNVYLSFGNLIEAEVLFRQSLAEEIALDSDLGQAINYANIGAIFERRQMYDSAYFYYQRSMERNISAGSRLGIGLCHIYFGKILEKQNEYEGAESEYQKAFEVMSEISDTWHTLEATLAIARIQLLIGNPKKSLEHIKQAKEGADAIRSPEHLSTVYALLHDYHKKRGDYIEALHAFKISKVYEDTVQNMKKMNMMIETRLDFEREKHQQYIASLHQRNKTEGRQKQAIIYASLVSLGLLIVSLIALSYAYVQRTTSNRVLRRLNRIRTDFFTNVTHEFRTPLTVILGLSNLLQSEKEITEAETNSYLSAIDRQGTHLLALVSQLLNMSKINAGMDNPRWQKGDVVAYVRMVVDSFRLYAKSQQIDLVFSSSDPVIAMDFIPHYMENILQNLISNAIKFSPPKSEILVDLTQNSNRIALKVTDSGCGIAEEDLERVFDLFYQGQKNDKKNGTGIGLSYTRQMVEMMSGKIGVESEVCHGSVFTVQLPRQRTKEWRFPLPVKNIEGSSPQMELLSEKARSAADLPTPVRQAEAKRSVKKATALLVEDNEDVLLYLKSFLEDEFNVVLAHDGMEGMELATELVPDIIVSDIMMPNKDGLEICREVRESELLNHIPLILLTAKSTLDDRLKGLKHGADAYIKKPFHPNELLVQMAALLENRRLLKEKYMHSVLRNDPLPKNDINRDFLQKATDIVYSEMHRSSFSVSVLADKLCISSSQLNRKLNAIAGHTPSGFIMKLRIERAKKKLVFENTPIGQIAEECGFYDVAYFSRTFKKHLRVSPSQYRRTPR